jgi:hypothetical protein
MTSKNDVFNVPEEKELQLKTIWEDLSKLPPEETAKKTGTELNFENDKAIYSFPFFQEIYKLDTNLKLLIAPKGAKSTFQELVTISSYFINTLKGPAPGISGKEVGPFTLPSGSFFFKGPHALPGSSLAEKYGEEPEKLKEIALKWGANPHTQNGYKIRVLPFVEIYFYLEPKDPEFEAEGRFNFDSHILYYLALDGIFALTNELTLRLLAQREYHGNQ